MRFAKMLGWKTQQHHITTGKGSVENEGEDEDDLGSNLTPADFDSSLSVVDSSTLFSCTSSSNDLNNNVKPIKESLNSIGHVVSISYTPLEPYSTTGRSGLNGGGGGGGGGIQHPTATSGEAMHLPSHQITSNNRQETGSHISQSEWVNLMSQFNLGQLYDTPFQYILGAATTPCSKINEESLTYLNQGQSYELKLKKLGDAACSDTYMKSIVRVIFHERRLQYMEKEQLDTWKQTRPGERILDIDIPLSYGLVDVQIDPEQLSSLQFVWDAQRESSGVYIKLNAISTEFTARRHGGEKGVPFRIQVETYSFQTSPSSSNNLAVPSSADQDPMRIVHCASCQVKVFKPKGADRKYKTDKDKIDKKSETEKEKFQPSFECTVLTEISLDQVRSYLDQLNVNVNVNSNTTGFSGKPSIGHSTSSAIVSSSPPSNPSQQIYGCKQSTSPVLQQQQQQHYLSSHHQQLNLLSNPGSGFQETIHHAAADSNDPDQDGASMHAHTSFLDTLTSCLTDLSSPNDPHLGLGNSGLEKMHLKPMLHSPVPTHRSGMEETKKVISYIPTAGSSGFPTNFAPPPNITSSTTPSAVMNEIKRNIYPTYNYNSFNGDHKPQVPTLSVQVEHEIQPGRRNDFKSTSLTNPPMQPPQAVTTNLTAKQVVQWLEFNRFSNFIEVFHNFSGSDLLRLTRADLIQICGLADGIRLNNALQAKHIRPKLTLYVYPFDSMSSPESEASKWKARQPGKGLASSAPSSPSGIMSPSPTPIQQQSLGSSSAFLFSPSPHPAISSSIGSPAAGRRTPAPHHNQRLKSSRYGKRGSADSISSVCQKRLRTCPSIGSMESRIDDFEGSVDGLYALYLETTTADHLADKLASLYNIQACQIQEMFYRSQSNDIHIIVTDPVVQNFKDHSKFSVELREDDELPNFYSIFMRCTES